MLESSVLNDEKIFDRIELLFGEILERREKKKFFLISTADLKSFILQLNFWRYDTQHSDTQHNDSQHN
jgi:hypothetical protein